VNRNTIAELFAQPTDGPIRELLPSIDVSRNIRCWRIGSSGFARNVGEARTDLEHTWVYHSPDGFEWGYGGSGPSDFALNLLGLVVAPPEAWRLHHAFKRDVVAKLPREGGVITVPQIVRWVEAQWDFERVAERAQAELVARQETR